MSPRARGYLEGFSLVRPIVVTHECGSCPTSVQAEGGTLQRAILGSMRLMLQHIAREHPHLAEIDLTSLVGR